MAKNEPTMCKRAEKLIDDLYEDNDQIKEAVAWLREQNQALRQIVEGLVAIAEPGPVKEALLARYQGLDRGESEGQP